MIMSAVSCINNDFTTKPNTDNKGIVNLQLRVPKATNPLTRVVDENAENHVKTVEVLLFDLDGKYTYKPIYSDNISSDATDNSLKTFTITVPEGAYDMVVLANSREILANALMGFSKGATKEEEVLSKLSLLKEDKWTIKSNSSEQFPIPMWGEIKNIVIESSLSKKTSINMFRMVSRVDVVLATQDARDNFSLESVRIYNYNNRGLVAPTEANWDEQAKLVTNATVPSAAIKLGNPMSSTPLYLFFLKVMK